MSYIGNTLPANFQSLPAVQRFNGTGSATAFTLAAQIANDQSILVSVDGVTQDSNAYSVSGTTLTFTAAPSSGTGNIFVNTISPVGSTVVPPDGLAITATTGTFSGDVGIGTTVPYTTSNLNVAGATSTSTTAFAATNPPAAGQLDIRSTDAYTTQRGGKLTLSGNSGTSGAVTLSVYGAIQGVKENATIDNAGGGLAFSTTLNANGLLTERLRITEAGSVLVGTTSTSSPFDGCKIALDANTSDGIRIRSSGVPMRFIATSTSTFVGSISTDGSSTAYNTSSDYRLKENVNYTWDATTRLKQLKPARFNFIIDDTNTLVDGFLAHEAQAVVPEAITGTKDEVDDNGDAVMQGIDQSKLVPLLVKTIQELEARITALET